LARQYYQLLPQLNTGVAQDISTNRAVGIFLAISRHYTNFRDKPPSNGSGLKTGEAVATRTIISMCPKGGEMSDCW
jgi:hypothetical protein